MYNPEIKNRYLENYEPSSVKSFSRVFKRIGVVEAQLEKDLFDFNRDEVKSVLFLMNPIKINTSKFNGNMIRSYIDWAITEGYRTNTINPLNGIDGKWYEQFVDKSRKTVYHKDEIDKLISLCVNDQDKAIIIALFEGVTTEELLTLKPSGINRELKMLSWSEDSRRLNVSPECIDLLIAASTQKYYEKSNGDAVATTKSLRTELIDNGRVIKVSNTKANDNDDGVGKNVIYRRFKTIQNSIKDYEYISPLNVRNSGMLYLAYILYGEQGELKTVQLDAICEKFDVAYNKERKIFNRYNLTGDFLNERTLLEVYGSP
jgi:hypothetical protein